jgi:hypothetical protein
MLDKELILHIDYAALWKGFYIKKFTNILMNMATKKSSKFNKIAINAALATAFVATPVSLRAQTNQPTQIRQESQSNISAESLQATVSDVNATAEQLGRAARSIPNTEKMTDDQKQILEAIAKHKNTDHDTLYFLSKSSAWEVRKDVVENRHSDQRILFFMTHDSNSTVANEAMSRMIRMSIKPQTTVINDKW